MAKVFQIRAHTNKCPNYFFSPPDSLCLHLERAPVVAEANVNENVLSFSLWLELEDELSCLTHTGAG